MISVDAEIRKNHPAMLKNFRSEFGIDILDYEDFLFNMLDKKEKESSITYPYEVRLAPSIDEMLRGNMEPSKVFTVDRPIQFKGHTIWTGRSDRDIDLNLGLVNRDKRYLSLYKLSGEVEEYTGAHGLLVGTTGSGKSVASHSIIFSLLFQYAPWELNLILSDAKISEFKRYGVMDGRYLHVPHISAIAATGDPGFYISILEKYIDDMYKLNDVFGSVGVQNLKEFRKVTGLTLPRNLLYSDEVTAQLKVAGKSGAKRIQNLLDDAGRLGRSTGYHFIVASQETPDEIKPILSNIKVRMCLLATSKVSQVALGNTQGADGDVGKGKMYVNAKNGEGSAEDNTFFQVPYQTPEEFKEEINFLDSLNQSWKVRNSVFYDEQEKFELKEFKDLINVEREGGNDLILGIPSFLSETPNKLSLNFKNNDIENILVFTSNKKLLQGLIQAFIVNAYWDITHPKKCNNKHVFLIADWDLVDGFDLNSMGFKSVLNIRKISDSVWKDFRDTVYYRTILYTIDEKAFREIKYDEEDVKFLKLLEDKKLAISNELNKSRVHYIMSSIKNGDYDTEFGLRNLNSKDRGIFARRVTQICFTLLKSLGSEYQERKIEKNSFPVTYIHVLGAHKVDGLGRSSTSPSINSIKIALSDSYLANMRFVFYTNPIDSLSDLRNSFKWMVLDDVGNYASRLKCEDYPEEQRNACAILFCASEGTVQSYKKIKMPR